MEKYSQNSSTAPSPLTQVVMRRQYWFFFLRKIQRAGPNTGNTSSDCQCCSITNATYQREHWHNRKNSTRPLTLTSSCHSPHSHPSQPILSSQRLFCFANFLLRYRKTCNVFFLIFFGLVFFVLPWCHFVVWTLWLLISATTVTT